METELERDGTEEAIPDAEAFAEDMGAPADEVELTEADILAAEMADRGEAQPEPFERIRAAVDSETEEEEEATAVDNETARAIARVRKYVEKNKDEILGDMAENWAECLVCTYWQIPGYMPMEPAPPEVHASLLGWLGQRPEEEYMPDNFSRQCESCKGLGETSTGSKVFGQEKLSCVPCKGMGWIAVGPERQGGYVGQPANGGTAQYDPLPSGTPALQPAPDDSPEIAALKAAGYLVIPPYVPTG